MKNKLTKANFKNEVDKNFYLGTDQPKNYFKEKLTQKPSKNNLDRNDLFLIKSSNENSNFIQKKSEIKVFATKDSKLLKQYYDLRHFSYVKENGWKNYDGSENEFDRNGKIIVATKDEKVIGGCRIMISNQCKILSNEIPQTKYNYKNVIKKYDKREDLVFGEISSGVVVKEERNRLISKKMLGASLEEFKKHGCDYIFAVAVAVACRNYRIIFREFGYFMEIAMSSPWQERETYNFDKMFPMYFKIC
jgi:hypothetical protein